MRSSPLLILSLCFFACSSDDGSESHAGSGGGSSIGGGGSGAGGAGASGGSAGAASGGASGSGSGGSAGSAGSGATTDIPPYSKGKFLPTFAIKYGNASKGARPAEETAKFDVLITTYGHVNAWKDNEASSWKNLAKLNSDQLVFVYALGLAEYNTADWGQLGYENGTLVEGWEWMQEQHGAGSADPWIEVGKSTGLPLYNTAYPGERMMKLGNLNWIRYWRDKNYGDLFGGGRGIDLDGVDGIFSDNTSLFQPVQANSLKSEGTNQSDDATAYATAGGFDKAKWKEDMKNAFREVIPHWREQGVLVIPNASPGYPNYANGWVEMEQIETAEGVSAAPFGGFEEGGYVSPYGSTIAYHVYNWEDKLAGAKAASKLRVFQTCHGLSEDTDFSLAPMSTPDSAGTTGWDALWFCVGSFLLAFDDVNGNGYLGFTRWGYQSYRFFDEFDPTHLHLGKALAPDEKIGSVHAREFEDGWVVVNGTPGSATFTVPGGGKAKPLDHDTFESSDSVTAVSSVTVPGLRALVLLKPGKSAGNVDN